MVKRRGPRITGIVRAGGKHYYRGEEAELAARLTPEMAERLAGTGAIAGDWSELVRPVEAAAAADSEPATAQAEPAARRRPRRPRKLKTNSPARPGPDPTSDEGA